MIKIQKFRFNGYRESTYVIWEEESKETFILDPGCGDDVEQAMLADFISEQKLIPVKILNTHYHVDHILGNAFCKKKYQIPLIVHEKEMPLLERAPIDYPGYHFEKYEHVLPDEFFGDKIWLGKTKFEVWHLPGHAPGHVAILNKEEKKCFTGDVLFKGHIGITDFFMGNKENMKKSLMQLMTLDDDVEVFPGHGFFSEIGAERDNVKKYILEA